MTQPPDVFDPLVREWRCGHSGSCCDAAWRIDLRPSELRAMADVCFSAGESEDALHLLDEHREARRIDGLCAVPRAPTGACWFRRDGHCAYWHTHGPRTLPVPCIKFPYLALLTPERRLRGLSFACPTALRMLARQSEVEIIEAEPLVDDDPFCYDFSGSDEDGSAEAARQFWAIHWQWVELLRRASGSPAERLRELGRRASGAELPRQRVARRFWSRASLEEDLAPELWSRGAEREVVAALFHSPVPPQPPVEFALEGDEDELLDRYFLHRLLLPEFMLKGASLGRLLGVLFALLARYRMVREGGTAPLDAIRHLDQLALHSNFTLQLFPESVEEAAAWQSLAMVALAEDEPGGGSRGAP